MFDSLKPPRTFDKIEKILFFILLLIFLLPVWLNKYYLTGDGPSHVYNSKVLLDLITSKGIAFYSNYFSLNSSADPNWFSHVILTLLLSIFPAFLAEKIFITVYIILFAVAFRKLIFVINPRNLFLSSLGILFAFNSTFQMGFYNYSFSFIFYFLSVTFWIKYSDVFNGKRMLFFTLLSLLLYFTHPIFFLLLIFTVSLFLGIKTVSELWEGHQNRKQVLLKGFYQLCKALLTVLPGIILFGFYLKKMGVSIAPNPNTISDLFISLERLMTLVLFNSNELIWAKGVLIVLEFILAYAIVSKFWFKVILKWDAFFIAFLVMMVVYFIQPGGIAGAGILSIRLQIIPFLMLIIWFASIKFADLFRSAILVVCFFIGIALVVVRFPSQKNASQAIEEYFELSEHLSDNCTVLPLQFSFAGKTPQGQIIANKSWLFMHAGDYLGTQKQIVILTNYEASTRWFPISWNPEKNPYMFIAVNEGFENEPPNVDIISYPDKTGGSIDYVTTWCLDEQFIDHPNTISLFKQLHEKYDLIYTSSLKRAKLFKRKAEFK